MYSDKYTPTQLREGREDSSLERGGEGQQCCPQQLPSTTRITALVRETRFINLYFPLSESDLTVGKSANSPDRFIHRVPKNNQFLGCVILPLATPGGWS